MANTFTPTISGTFDGEMVWNITSYVVSDSFPKYVDSMEIVHRPKSIIKKTGFESYRHITHKHSGDDVLIDISLTLAGNIPRWLMQQLKRLAIACNGAGIQIDFREDWLSNYTYKCRWTNAGDFAENTALTCGGSMILACWEWSAI